MLALKIVLWILLCLVILLVAVLMFRLRIEVCLGSLQTGVFLRVLWMRFDIIRLVRFFTSRGGGGDTAGTNQHKTVPESVSENGDGYTSATHGKIVSGTSSACGAENVSENVSEPVSGDTGTGSVNGRSEKGHGGKNPDGERAAKSGKSEKDPFDISEIKDIPDIPDIPEIPYEKLEKARFMVGFVYEVVKNVWGYMGIKIRRLRIVAATGDAATTAQVYGIICGVLSGIFAYIDNFKKVKTSGRNAIDISADFLGEKTVADVSIELSFFVWQIAHVGIGALLKWIGGRA